MRSPNYDRPTSALLCEDSAKAQYAEAIAQGNALLDASSLEVQRWWQQLLAADLVLASEAVAES